MPVPHIHKFTFVQVFVVSLVVVWIYPGIYPNFPILLTLKNNTLHFKFYKIRYFHITAYNFVLIFGQQSSMKERKLFSQDLISFLNLSEISRRIWEIRASASSMKD